MAAARWGKVGSSGARCYSVQEADVRLDASVEVGQVHLLVRSVKVVVWEPEAQEQAVRAQDLLDHADDGDRSAGTRHRGSLAPDLFQGVTGGENGGRSTIHDG